MSKAYEVVTDRILAMIDKGVCPWRMPWSKMQPAPQANGASRRSYRGCNQFLTALVAYTAGYTSPYWLSYRQAQELGGQVRKGEHGCPIVYAGEFNPTDAETGEKSKRTAFFMRYSTVFNACQIDGLPAEFLPTFEPENRTEFQQIADCEAILAGFAQPIGPEVIITGDRACYSPALDRVKMPKPETFDSSAHYYATLFHELGHSTGHADRLARKGVTEGGSFGSETYGHEELVAELTSAFLCHRAGIDSPTIENSAAYLNGWRKAIKADVKLIIVAAAQAQKAADYILGIKAAEVAEEAAAA